MSQGQILILNPFPEEADRLSKVASAFGTVTALADLQNIHEKIAGASLSAAVIECGLARSPVLKDLLRPATALVLTGTDPDSLRQAAEEWPAGYYVDLFILSPGVPQDRFFSRAMERALENARQRAEAEGLRRSTAGQEAKLRDVYAEIQEIKGLINSNFLLEIEKRIAIETKYVWFQKERQRIEAILRKIYAADDVSSLLDILPDIRDVVKAASATVYIIEGNESSGRYLKPLVWDNAYLSHAEFSRYIAPWDAPDFAATAARYGQGINAAELSQDRRMSKRYAEFMRTPLKNLLAVPIMHSRKVIGVVEVYNKTELGKVCNEGFSRQDQQILQGISEHMAIAMTKLNLIQYDALTGLLRPDPFVEKVLQKVNALGKRRREEGGFALVMGDVDWFKNYNDRNGHEAGNRLLRELAHVLKLSIREEDLLCRYGGEEFLFFLTGAQDIGEASMLTERIRKNVEDHYFEFQEYQPQNNLTMSFGVTVFPKRRTEQPHSLTREDLKRLAAEADLAMAEAKGKRRPDLKRPEGPESAPVKNRVSSYASEKDEGPRKADPRPPQERSIRERRRHERMNASTVMMIKENGAFRVAKTVNISLGGVRIVSDARLPPAQTMETILVLGDRATPIKSDVIYSEKPEGESPFFYSGLRFRDLSHADIRALEDYLVRFRRKIGPDA
jgi:diguanylate cyclase (GGDEF)-like protein